MRQLQVVVCKHSGTLGEGPFAPPELGKASPPDWGAEVPAGHPSADLE
jgi:hypothetical protein